MEAYDRMKEVKEFDESKVGVKGLVDSGITTIPKIFQYELDNRPVSKPATSPLLQIPTIDLSSLHDSERRPSIVQQVRDAASDWGFFQIINHNIPVSVLNSAMDAIKSFHEQPQDIKKKYYGRQRPVTYNTNIDLFRSKAASWRDTLIVETAPKALNPEKIPEICRKALLSWDEYVEKLGDVFSELLCEGLGIKPTRFKELKCLTWRAMACHYYPHCPQVDLTMGFPSHTDKQAITVVLQNQGGLQVKHGEEWVDVKHVPGALLVNIADILQMISNDIYKSVEHRVLANPHQDPRISIVTFIGPDEAKDGTDCYEPLEELLSQGSQPHYRKFKVSEINQKIKTNELANMSLFKYFKL